MVTPDTVASIQVAIDVLNATGTLGLLAVFAYLSYSGRIISRPVLDRILQAYGVIIAEQFSRLAQDLKDEIVEIHSKGKGRGRGRGLE